MLSFSWNTWFDSLLASSCLSVCSYSHLLLFSKFLLELEGHLLQSSQALRAQQIITSFCVILIPETGLTGCGIEERACVLENT